MKRALSRSEYNNKINLFRLYDGCLMNVAVIDWCKLFSNSGNQRCRWQKLFPKETHSEILQALNQAMVEGEDDLEKLQTEMTNARDMHFAHHDFDEARPTKYPKLGNVRATSVVIFDFIQNRLKELGSTPLPYDLGDNIQKQMEEIWMEECQLANATILKHRQEM